MAAAPDVIVAGQPFVLVHEPVAAPAIVVAAGRQGPPGPPGDGSALGAFEFAFGDASTRLLHTITKPSLLASVQLIITTPFNGEGAALRIRTQAGVVLLDSDQVAPDFAATYESTPGASLAAGTGIYLEITPGAGATAGAGFVVLNLN
ncbi:hypothetical protein [Pseudomonas sp. EggHat1]|uniref:hypothetical protein n=1 Tax=Pseudomonas sp. EggHat1 TaxID=2761624 RepID=UPI0018671871|nr:hypothetical protein [Pseudomonas sp. EggHat1]